MKIHNTYEPYTNKKVIHIDFDEIPLSLDKIKEHKFENINRLLITGNINNQTYLLENILDHFTDFHSNIHINMGMSLDPGSIPIFFRFSDISLILPTYSDKVTLIKSFNLFHHIKESSKTNFQIIINIECMYDLLFSFEIANLFKFTTTFLLLNHNLSDEARKCVIMFVKEGNFSPMIKIIDERIF